MSEWAEVAGVAASYFRIGERAQLDERYADAANHYERALRGARNFEPARFNLGVVELRSGRAWVAAEMFEALLRRQDAPRIRSRHLPIAFNHALARASAGEVERAWEVAREVVLAVLERPVDADGDGDVVLRRRLEGSAMALLATIGVRWAREQEQDRDQPLAARLSDAPASAWRGALIGRLAASEPDLATAALAAECAREARDDEPRTSYLLACYDAAIGDVGRALDELETALARDLGSIEWARRDPLLDVLRAREPHGFRTVIRWARMGRSVRSIGLPGAPMPIPEA